MVPFTLTVDGGVPMRGYFAGWNQHRISYLLKANPVPGR